MKANPILSGVFLAALFSLPAQAAEPGVTIKSPKDGAKWDALAQNRLEYEVVPGPRGDHVHLYVDGKEIGVLRKLEGSHPMEALAPGLHTVCIKVVSKAHVPVGVEQCVKVTVE